MYNDKNPWICVLYVRYVYVYICFIAKLFAKGEEYERGHTKLLKWIPLGERKCRGRIIDSQAMTGKKNCTKRIFKIPLNAL